MEEEKTNRSIRKCRATGKVSFDTKTEARLTIIKLKWSAIIRRNKIDGSRLKHRAGKIAQSRVYFCSYCNGYHLTKWTKTNYNNYIDVIERKRASNT
ncbi:hypothetical protein [Sphingobacterium pedocola]|uniref:Uncharacterized protein n=1 Tax=Sphingobacterium pedocola TaxID=2082722 RepID=A0ABR9T4T0_9SPHI|nr:hypothetical protein [Sphingobacterium pedocola]MBE8719662.1 hypothetical protein [Sphingobacterium pedocola]